jgi:hypothetical protein
MANVSLRMRNVFTYEEEKQNGMDYGMLGGSKVGMQKSGVRSQESEV